MKTVLRYIQQHFKTIGLRKFDIGLMLATLECIRMNLSRPTISAIESGQRKVTAEELDRFSKLYGVSTEKLMHGTVSNTVETEMFARTFSELSDIDQKEIMNLIDFKRKYKGHMNG